MIGGETGTGKELIARAVHYLSPRSDRAFVPIDCGAIPPELTESELFGHERGAFTGAVAQKPRTHIGGRSRHPVSGRSRRLEPECTGKLLRFLQEREYRPLGSSEIKKADVRVISATNRDLQQRVRNKEFREDLYYRLNVVQLRLPGLRQRREDVVLLARHFAAKYTARFNKLPLEFSRGALQRLLMHHWPGNIRELENVVAAAVALCDGPLIRASDLLLAARANPVSGQLHRGELRRSQRRRAARVDRPVSGAARRRGDPRRSVARGVRHRARGVQAHAAQASLRRADDGRRGAAFRQHRRDEDR